MREEHKWSGKKEPKTPLSTLYQRIYIYIYTYSYISKYRIRFDGLIAYLTIY